MIGALVLFLQTAATAAVSSTNATVAVRVAKHTTPVPIVVAKGARAVAGDKLASALGGKFVRAKDGHFTLVVGESQLDFTPDVPFARADSVVVPMVTAPSLVGSTLYLPFQVVSEIVPSYITGFMYDSDADEIRAFSASVGGGASRSARASAKSADTKSDGADTSDESTEFHSRGHGRRLVVVDAGHGGVDNGMHGPIGGGPQIYEKNITLSVAKLLAQDLREAGVDVLMTRTTDTLIALADRGRIANRNHGDVFVSIHVNATGQRGKAGARDRGFETYFLSEAKTEDAKRVENMENQAVRFETGVNAPKGDPLSFILNDMAQNEHLRESSELAQIIEDGLHTFHPGPDRGVQQANFAVLRGSYMPAVLCEIGFGTNPQEAAYISSSANQRKIAHSIAHSVITYLNRYEARVSGATGGGP